MKKRIKKISAFVVVLIIIAGWFFSGLTQLFYQGHFLPKVQTVHAATVTGVAGTTAGVVDTSYAADDCTDDMAWDGTGSPGNGSSSNNVYIAENDNALDSGNVSDELQFSNFGIVVPGSGNTIDGVVVEMERFSAAAVTDAHIMITTTAGAQEGNDKSAGATWATSDPNSYAVSFGGSTDTWGATGGLTEAEVEGTGFGVILCAKAGAANTHPSIDSLRITVYYTADTTAPTITNVTSDKTNGSYKAGEVIDIDVTFSEAVTSTGNVTVELETGVTDQTCTFTVSAATTGTCNYTVQAGDTSSDLTVKSFSGTIKDAALNAMTNYVPTTNLAANKALVIDTTVPVISSTAPATSASINSITTSSDVSYTLSEAIASGTIVMTRTGGTADASSPRTCTLVGTALSTGAHSAFDMSNTTNGCTVAQSLVSGAVYTFAFNATDAAGNAATQVSNTSVTFETTAPTVSTLSPADNATGVSVTENLVMTFTETVAVNSTGSSGPSNGGTFADDATVGTIAWTSASNAQTSNDSRAQARFTNAATSHYHKATNFGFSIPIGSTITGITAEVEKSRSKPAICNTLASAVDSSVKIVKGGTISGNEKAVAGVWPVTASEAYTTYGGSSDLWGLTWTADDINASTFGFVISAVSNDADSSDPGFEVCVDSEVDHVRITVAYSLNVTIKKTSDNSTVETIGITSGQVTGTGTATITINPSVTLVVSTEYYVQVSASALQDVAGNDYAGIADTTSWSFTTTGSGPTYVATGNLYSASIDTDSYPTINNKNVLRATWSQDLPSGCTIQLYMRGTNTGPTPNYATSSWAGPYSGSGATVIQNLTGVAALQGWRYFQYRIDMASCSANTLTPTLFNIQIDFD